MRVSLDGSKAVGREERGRTRARRGERPRLLYLPAFTRELLRQDVRRGLSVPSDAGALPTSLTRGHSFSCDEEQITDERWARALVPGGSTQIRLDENVVTHSQDTPGR
jgi:hypothetical protein